MPAKTSSGHDHLSMELMKLIVPCIAQPLYDIVNIFFATGSFPGGLKIAKFRPLSKKDDHSIYTNYRPILILPSFPKAFEKLSFAWQHEQDDPSRL